MSGVKGVWRVIKSDFPQTSARSISWMPSSAAASFGRAGSNPITSMLRAVTIYDRGREGEGEAGEREGDRQRGSERESGVKRSSVDQKQTKSHR